MPDRLSFPKRQVKLNLFSFRHLPESIVTDDFQASFVRQGCGGRNPAMASYFHCPLLYQIVTGEEEVAVVRHVEFAGKSYVPAILAHLPQERPVVVNLCCDVDIPLAFE